MERPQPQAGTRASEEDARTADVVPVRVRPTQQGTVYLWTIGVFSLTLLVLGENLVFLLGAFALGCGTVAWFLTRRNLRGLAFERDLPRTTTAGVPTTLTWRVRNVRGAAAVGIEVEDRPARGVKPVCLQVEFPTVPGRSSPSCSTQVIFGRRGVVDLARGGAEAWSRYPLGLFRAVVPVTAPGRITVRPREGRPTATLRERIRGRRPVDTRRRRLWQGDDVIYGVREYREGDDPRRIHWRTTARRGVVAVSEWRAEQGREAVIVLGRGFGAGPVTGADFERAVSAAATLWRLCSREHLQARLVVGRGREPKLGEGGRGIGTGLDALASVRAQGSRSPRSAVRALRDSAVPRTIVYVAAGAEPGLETELAAAAGRGGSWLILRCHDRSVGRWIRGLA